MNYKVWRFLVMTTDPVHVGTGGMRLGRVDNTIVREPGTKLPKIPGTALHGAIRAYAARRYGKIPCAGQGQTEKSNHCGRPTCPICYTFGYSKGSGNSFSGVVSITDARILLFPVYSMVGPVWVSTFELLRKAGFTIKDKNGKILDEDSDLQKEKAYLTLDRTEKKTEDKAEERTGDKIDSINLGWLMVEVAGEVKVELPDNLKKKNEKDAIKTWEPIKNRIVLVPDNFFSQIVNSNLEVRTSIAINPETGAVEEGALFTYEAIPRATFLWFDVIADDFRKNLPTTERLRNWEEILNSGSEDDKKALLKKWKLWAEKDGDEKLDGAVKKATKWIEGEKFKNDNGDKEWKWENMKCKGEEAEEKDQKHDEKAILCIIESGLEWAEHLGIGGMGTRGFGRIKKIYKWRVK